jgi:hypothetical protein
MREPNGQTTGWFITPTWVNNGSTDAIDLWGWDSSRMFPTGVPRTFDFVNTRKLVGVLSKAVVTSGQPFLQMSKFITTDQAASIAGGKGHFIMWGYVEYREALPGNKVHHIHWCYETVTIDAGSSYIFSHPAFRPECNTSD